MRKYAVTLFSVLAVFALIGVGAIIQPLFQSDSVTVILSNRSDETISHGSVLIYDLSYSFEDLGVGRTAQISLPVRGEGAYGLDMKFASGRVLKSRDLGHVIPGVSFRDLVVISGSEIVLKKREAVAK